MAAPLPDVRPGDALGLVETVGLVAAVEAADAMLKAADVRLVRQQRTVPGLITHAVAGETAAVRAAVEAGRAAAERVGRVAAVHVIPRPDDSVWRVLLGASFSSETAPADPPTRAEPVEPTQPDEAAADLAALTVRDLRALVRAQPDAGLRGRAVATASREELLAALAGTTG